MSAVVAQILSAPRPLQRDRGAALNGHDLDTFIEGEHERDDPREHAGAERRGADPRHRARARGVVDAGRIGAITGGTAAFLARALVRRPGEAARHRARGQRRETDRAERVERGRTMVFELRGRFRRGHPYDARGCRRRPREARARAAATRPT